jgi:hypothetical protein
MPSGVAETYLVHCPYARAREQLRAAIETAGPDAAIKRLTLALPIGGATIERRVRVNYEHGTDPMHFDEPWRVRWTPEEGGPYPDFEGELTVRADETYEGAILELRGQYTPPLGIVGKAFDALAGSKIAATTTRGLLASLAARIEAQYRSEEAAKGR